jgi:hypothetical protein
MPNPALLPADGPPPTGPAAARAIAWRLYLKHRDASDALLEALAAADWARASNGRLVLAGPPEQPEGPDWDRCLAVAEKAVAGKLRWLLAGAERYHRANTRPVWAVGRTHIVEVDGFLFYRPTE